MAIRTVRWGFLSTARIGLKVWQSIHQSGNGVVAAVASRDQAKAEEYIREGQKLLPFREAPRAFGSYEALLADPGIDAVYVPLPTGLRAPWVEAAARAGKHVVCEKPCATSLGQLESMLRACESAKVQFMDGVMFMHGRRLAEMRAALDDRQKFGDLRRVTSAFCFYGGPEFRSSDIRLDSALEPFGALGDLGWYCLRLTLWAAQWKMPLSVTGKLLTVGRRPASPGDVPLTFSGELRSEGWSASFYASFDAALHQWAHFEGTKGGVRCQDFVVSPTGEFARFWRGPEEVVTTQSGDPSAEGQSTNLYRTFANLVLSGKVDPFWPDITWKTQKLMEACLEAARSDREVPVGS